MGQSNDPVFDPDDPPGFEPPPRGLSERAARARERVRRRILIWWLLTAMVGWGYAAFLVFMALRHGQGFLEAGLACVGFWWLGRWAFGPVRDVWRDDAYPGRHWELTGEGVGCLPVAIGVVGALAVLASVVILGLVRATDVNFVDLGSTALGLFLFLLWIRSNVGDQFHHVRVLPYFNRRVDEIHTYCNGHDLARHLLELDELAGSLGVAPLSTFGWNDDYCGETLVWHPAAAGLKTVNALLAHRQGDESEVGERAGLIDDLERIAHALDRADRSGIDFCLLLRHGDSTSGAEHDARKGTFF